VSAANPGELWAVFFTEFFSGVTVEGISALPLALLPLVALDGATLFKWKKWVWAVSYVVGLAAFMLVLLTIPAAWGEVQGDFLRWVLLFVGFAVFAVAVWGINALIERRKKTPAVETPPPAPAA
jgi:peptidoglycan/LPS O-acetylase OafA/YrhL